MGIRTLTVLVIFGLVGCNGGPEPPPTTTTVPATCAVWSFPEGCDCPSEAPFTPILGVCAPPRADRPVDWGAVRGVTSFSLALRSVRSVADFTYWIHEHEWTTLRVGAQTSHDWCRNRVVELAIEMEDETFERMMEDDLLFGMAATGYLPCGPPHASDEADQNLVRLLEVTARIPNTWVQLIPTFTYKSHDEGTQAKNVRYFNRMFDHVNTIVKAGGYKHVVYELFNEVDHPLSQHIKDEDVKAMFEYARAKTHLPIGTDHGGQGDGNNWRGRYPFIWKNVSTYIAFHTPRNPEPSYDLMKKAQDKYSYSKPVLVDETVCWASDGAIAAWDLAGKGTIAERGYGTEESRMLQVVRHLRNVHRVGWRPFYHMIWGIHCMRVGDMPNYNQDIKGES